MPPWFNSISNCSLDKTNIDPRCNMAFMSVWVYENKDIKDLARLYHDCKTQESACATDCWRKAFVSASSYIWMNLDWTSGSDDMLFKAYQKEVLSTSSQNVSSCLFLAKWLARFDVYLMTIADTRLTVIERHTISSDTSSSFLRGSNIWMMNQEKRRGAQIDTCVQDAEFWSWRRILDIWGMCVKQMTTTTLLYLLWKSVISIMIGLWDLRNLV